MSLLFQSRVLWLILIGTLLVSCVSMPSEQDSREEFVQQQKESARSLYDQGHIAASRNLWLTVLTLDGADDEAIESVAKLDSDIAGFVAQALNRGELAYKRGNTREGDLWMLKILAAQPGHETALARLRESQSAKARAQQREKSKEENYNSLARQRAAPGGVNEKIRDFYNRGAYQQAVDAARQIRGRVDPKIAGILRKSQIALADSAEGAGDLKSALAHVQSAISIAPLAQDPLLSRSATLRGQLSEEQYRSGLLLMSDDLSAAIEALEKALFYNPYNDAAKRKLLQAQKLEKNLRRIQGGGG